MNAHPNPRYSRQTILPELGADGQRRLAASRLLFIGAGGLGCAALPYLAGAGVGQITIVDSDTIELHNLHRQTLFAESDIGKPKAEAARARLQQLNSEIVIDARVERLDADNIDALLEAHDIVVDGSDNFFTKYLLGDATVRHGKPLVYGSVTGLEALITVFDAHHGPCLRCVFPNMPQGWVPNCAEAGVLGPLVGLVGSVQAAEALKWLIAGQRQDILKSLSGRLWTLDGRDMQSRQLRLSRRADCPGCGTGQPVAVTAPAPELSAGEAARLDAPLWVDVREPEEYRQAHIPGALNLPLSTLNASRATLPPAHNYIIYCAQGPRAQAAAARLIAAGVGGVHCLRGGLSAWSSAPD